MRPCDSACAGVMTFGAPLVACLPMDAQKGAASRGRLHDAINKLLAVHPHKQFHSYVHNLDMVPRVLGRGWTSALNKNVLTQAIQKLKTMLVSSYW